MVKKREKDDVRVILNIAHCLRALVEKERSFPTRNLKLKEKIVSARAAFDFKKAARENKHSKSKAQSLADALETLLPFYKKAYGEKNLLECLSALAQEPASIEHLRRLGADQTADLCEKARENELRVEAIRQENAAFLVGVWKKMNESNIRAADLIKKGPRQKRGPSF